MRLQWDPDHSPTGNKEERRAIQLGLRGETLRQFALEWTVRIDDITPQVLAQRENIGRRERLQTPEEHIYAVTDPDTRARIRLSPAPC